jgi:hypothetical protein
VDAAAAAAADVNAKKVRPPRLIRGQTQSTAGRRYCCCCCEEGEGEDDEAPTAAAAAAVSTIGRRRRATRIRSSDTEEEEDTEDDDDDDERRFRRLGMDERERERERVSRCISRRPSPGLPLLAPATGRLLVGNGTCRTFGGGVRVCMRRC